MNQAHDDSDSFIRTNLLFDSLESTNNHAAELLSNEAIRLPLVVRAKQQTRGRGRGSHTWWSDSGSLTFTLALDPVAHGLTLELEPRLALTMAVAIVVAAHSVKLGTGTLGIRWPNDIEANGRKIGGILTESIETTHGRRLLIGVGLNVTSNLDLAPADIQSMATSLEAIGQTHCNGLELGLLLQTIVAQFDACLCQLVTADPSLTCLWSQLDTLRGTWIRAQQGPRIISGWGRGIDSQGRLLVDDGEHILALVGGQILREPPDEPQN